MSIKFYNDNADAFFENTINADMTETYSQFVKYLPQKSHILDLGCGSGRDSLAFLNMGFKVLSADYSIEMVKKASIVTNQEVLYLDMLTLDFNEEFHGIWACASMLHISKVDIPNVLIRCHKALKNKGILYLSFKLNDKDEETRNGRHFSNFTFDSFLKVLPKNLFIIEKHWITEDVRPKRKEEKWLNLILKKLEDCISEVENEDS